MIEERTGMRDLLGMRLEELFLLLTLRADSVEEQDASQVEPALRGETEKSGEAFIGDSHQLRLATAIFIVNSVQERLQLVSVNLQIVDILTSSALTKLLELQEDRLMWLQKQRSQVFCLC